MIMRAGVVGLLLGAIIACSPACTTTEPRADVAQGLFMCSCGQVYIVLYVDGELTINPVEIGGKAPQPEQHQHNPREKTI
jgi:hypothetical protein